MNKKSPKDMANISARAESYTLLVLGHMSYSLQTNFVSVMKDWADKYRVWGTPTRSLSRSNAR